MTSVSLVRIGALGHVGRFRAAGGGGYRRGDRVVCRTRRGIETGEVLAPAGPGTEDCDGAVLRPMSVEDELLRSRLEKNKDQAYQACVGRLAERGIAATLMDVELLFDGKSIYFYFLGEPPADAHQVAAELAAAYEAEARLHEFGQLLEAGCGPACGTEEAAGGGCGSSCGSCAVKSACGSR